MGFRYRSAITGRWVKIKTWKRWPKFTVREKIKKKDA